MIPDARLKEIKRLVRTKNSLISAMQWANGWRLLIQREDLHALNNEVLGIRLYTRRTLPPLRLPDVDGTRVPKAQLSSNGIFGRVGDRIYPVSSPSGNVHLLFDTKGAFDPKYFSELWVEYAAIFIHDPAFPHVQFYQWCKQMNQQLLGHYALAGYDTSLVESKQDLVRIMSGMPLGGHNNLVNSSTATLIAYKLFVSGLPVHEAFGELIGKLDKKYSRAVFLKPKYAPGWTQLYKPEYLEVTSD